MNVVFPYLMIWIKQANAPLQALGATVGLKPLLRQKTMQTLNARPRRREAPCRCASGC